MFTQSVDLLVHFNEAHIWLKNNEADFLSGVHMDAHWSEYQAFEYLHLNIAIIQPCDSKSIGIIAGKSLKISRNRFVWS